MLLFGPIWGHFMSLRRCLNGERGGGEKKKQQNTTNPPRTPHHHCRFWGEKLRNGHKPPLPPLSAQHCCHQKPTSSTAMPAEGHGAVHCCADCSFWGHFLPFWGTFSHCFSFLNGWKTSKTWVDGDDPPGVKHHHSDTTAPNLSGSPVWVKNSTNTYFLPFLHVFWEVLLPGSLCLFVSGVHAASVLGQFPAVLVLSLICAKIPCCQHPAPLFFLPFFPQNPTVQGYTCETDPLRQPPFGVKALLFATLSTIGPFSHPSRRNWGGGGGCFWGNFGQKRGPSAPGSSRASQPPKMPEFPPKRATAPLVNWGGFGEFRESGAPSFPPSQTEPSWAFCLVSPPASLPSLRSQLTVWGHKA